MPVAHPSTPSRRSLRWAAPAVAVVALIGAGPLVDAVTANAHGSLPPRTAAQLLVDVQHPKVQALSGTVVETTDLGLPALPSIGGAGGDAASFSSLVSGSHTMRVWYDGPDRVRLALLGQLGESDLVRNGSDLWAWSSHDNTATHWTLPSEGTHQPLAPTTPAGPSMTPQQAAAAALRAIDPSTRVSTDPTAVVAGRPAYQLDLVPRDPRSLVGSVRIAIDGATHVPTRVQVFATGASSPAFEVGYTSFSTSTPPSSVFGFSPPPGATVKQGSALEAPSAGHHHATDAAAPQVFGKGWTSVVVARLSQGKAVSAGPAGMLRSLPAVSGTWGSGHLLHSSLFSVVLTDDGRVAIGAVAPHLLYDALSHR
jgi:outer membrane lipoprotein-sorting protein